MKRCADETKGKWSSNIINLALDGLLFINLALLIMSGIVLHHSLPHGQRYLSLWGMNRHGWGDIHALTGFIFLFLSIIHLALHWRWWQCMIIGKRKHKAPILITLASLILVIGLATALFLSPVVSR